jgi:hypothetical protein
MKAAVRVMLLAVFLAAAAAPAALIIGPALPGHLVAPWWISAQPHSQAAVFGPSHCHKAARHHRANPDYVIPPECVNSAWNAVVSPPPPGDAPPPPDDAP